jgi:hypothetical protein
MCVLCVHVGLVVLHVHVVVDMLAPVSRCASGWHDRSHVRRLSGDDPLPMRFGGVQFGEGTYMQR